MDYDGLLRLPDLCAECGAELMLTPSGHPFCADPACTEGFSVAANPAWQLYKLLDDALNGRPLKLEKKHHH
jgi:hypothetical protein